MIDDIKYYRQATAEAWQNSSVLEIKSRELL